MIEYREIHSTEDPDFKDVIKVYNEGFREQKEIYIDPIVFTWMLNNDRKDIVSHIAVLKSGRVIGMTSFSSMPSGAIGWYITIIDEERKKGYASVLLEKIKDTIMKDTESKQWHEKYLFAEFEQDKAELWGNKGFTILPVRYYQPPLLGNGDWVPLLLGVMPIKSDTITGAEILKFVSDLYQKIYNVPNFKESDYFKNIKEDCEFLSMRL